MARIDAITKQECYKTAQLCKTKSEWHTLYGSYYIHAKRTGDAFFKKCTKHMQKKKPKYKYEKDVKPRSYWNKTNSLKKAQEFDSRSSWHEYSPGSYAFARKNGSHFYQKCTKHMERSQVLKKGSWTKEAILKEAKKYKTLKEWKVNSASSHSTAIKRGRKFLNQCCKHFPATVRHFRTWNNKEILKECKKYQTKCEWHDKSTLSYRTALKDPKLFKKCIQHMDLRAQESWGEIQIGLILSHVFKVEFKKIKLPKIGEIDRYAEVLLNDRIIKIGIEHQGVMHYRYTPRFHKNKEDFESRKKFDLRKYRKARRSGIILLRIKDLRGHYKCNTKKISNKLFTLFKLNKISVDKENVKFSVEYIINGTN